MAPFPFFLLSTELSFLEFTLSMFGTAASSSFVPPDLFFGNESIRIPIEIFLDWLDG
jgi:hypothetical protein